MPTIEEVIKDQRFLSLSGADQVAVLKAIHDQPSYGGPEQEPKQEPRKLGPIVPGESTSTVTGQPVAAGEMLSPAKNISPASTEPYVRPALEYGGMLAGSAVGVPAGPGTVLAGGALGYAGGKGIADVLYTEQQSPQQEAMQAGRDVLTGATMEAGGQVLGKAIPYALGKVGVAGRNMLGKLTGTGAGSTEEAFLSGTRTGLGKGTVKSITDFDKALRGEMTGQEIAANAKSALGRLKDARGVEYRRLLDKVRLDKNVQNDIRDRVSDKIMGLIGKEKFDIKPTTNSSGRITGFDMSESTLVESQPVIAKALKDLAQWKDYTASGLDTLKKRLSTYAGQVKIGSPQESFLSQLKNSLSDELKKSVPKYAEMTKGYAEATELIKDVESGLMLRKQGMSGRIVADQTLRRLTSAMHDNFALRRDLVKALQGDGTDLSGQIAGYSMNALTPRGISGSGMAIIQGGAIAMIKPSMWPILAASSPRVSGEFLRMFGKAMSEVSGTGPAIGRAATYNAMSQQNNNALTGAE